MGISFSCVAFDTDKFFYFFQNIFCINQLRVKTWFWITFWIYCKNTKVFPIPNNGSNYWVKYFAQSGLSWLNCGILRFLIMFEKNKKEIKYFSSFIIIFYSLSSSINVIFPSEMSLLDINMASQLSIIFCYHKCYVHLGYHKSFSYFFSKVEHRHFTVFYNCLCFLRTQFFIRKWFLF